MKKILIFLSLCMIALYGNDTLKHGWFGRAGIGIADLVHQAGQSRSQSVFASLYIDGGYTFANQMELGYDVQIGSSPNKLSNGLPLVGIQSFTNLPTPKGGGNIVSDMTITIGYNLISSPKDHPLYLGTGLVINNFAIGAVDIPVTAIVVNTYLPLEIKGNLIKGKWGLEYLASYDLQLQSAIGILGEIQETKQLPINGGYALRANIGFTYQLSQKYFFFATMIFRYANLNASQKTTITTIADTVVPGAKPNTSNEVYYPKSHTTYIGMRFGFGF